MPSTWTCSGLCSLSSEPFGAHSVERVVIGGGALRGFSGLYAGQSARERELVLINILGAPRRVEIAAGLVVPSQ